MPEVDLVQNLRPVRQAAPCLALRHVRGRDASTRGTMNRHGTFGEAQVMDASLALPAPSLRVRTRGGVRCADVSSSDTHTMAADASAEPTDASLIVESLTVPRAFMPIVDRHQRILYGYLARRVGADIAEDLVAETFTRAFAQRDRFDQSWSDARPWLFGIALNLLRSHMRSEGRRLRAYARSGRLERGADEIALDDVAARLDASTHGPALADALANLSNGDREALLLYAWADMSYDEIASTLDIPVGTVRSRLNRARRIVREGLEQQGILVGGGADNLGGGGQR